MYTILLFLLLSKTVVGQVLLTGSCDVTSDQVEVDVDIKLMLGTWYQQGRIPNSREFGDCSTIFFYIVNPEIGGVLYKENFNGKVRNIYGFITRSYDSLFKFNFTFATGSYAYYVLSTNYKDYALIYSCQSHQNNTKSVWAWLLSRMKYYAPSTDVVEKLAEVVRRNPDVNVTWIPVNHKKCIDFIV